MQVWCSSWIECHCQHFILYIYPVHEIRPFVRQLFLMNIKSNAITFSLIDHISCMWYFWGARFLVPLYHVMLALISISCVSFVLFQGRRKLSPAYIQPLVYSSYTVVVYVLTFCWCDGVLKVWISTLTICWLYINAYKVYIACFSYHCNF